jgi:hypothetical protein
MIVDKKIYIQKKNSKKKHLFLTEGPKGYLTLIKTQRGPFKTTIYTMGALPQHWHRCFFF